MTTSSFARRLLLTCLTLPFAAAGAHAAGAGGAAPGPFATNWWWWTAYFSTGVAARSNVLTLCIVILCFSLFIMMKKFGPGDGPGRD